MAAKLTLEEGTSPSTPASGFLTIFCKPDHSVWYKDDAGFEHEFSIGTSIANTDDLPEGSLNLYFTIERAQDAVGNALLNTTTINLTYNDGANVFSADVNPGSLTNTQINAAAAIAYSKLNLAGSIVNADINASAAIVYSKLALTGSVTNADLAGSIAYSKLVLSNSIVNADINSSAAVSYSKLNLANSVVDADIATGAAIELDKLAALTASKALVSNGSGVITASSVTSTELGYVAGVTSAIQTQLNGKQASGSYVLTSRLINTTSPLLGGGSLASDLTLSIQKADATHDGYLAQGDWSTFNSKQAAGNYLTALSGDVVATGPGSAVATISAGAIDNSKVSATAAIAYSKLALTGSIVNSDVNASAAIAYSKLALTGSIVNADVNASAAIAYSKLSLTGSILNADLAGSITYSKLILSNSIVNADINTAAAIAYSKLALTNSIVNADVNATAAIAYSKLALSNSIVNADINATAAIAHSKMAALTANKALQSDASGFVAASAVTSTELGYLSGVTSSIQTQLAGFQPLDSDLTALAGLTTNGILVRTGTGTATTRTIQGNTQIGVSNGDGVSADPVISINAASITNAQISTSAAIAYSKLSLTGSIVNADVAGGAAIAYSKLALTGSILNADLAGSIAYSKLVLSNSIVNADINTAAAIAYSKLALTGSIVNADIATAAAIARSKLAAGTANTFVRNDQSGNLIDASDYAHPRFVYESYDDFEGATNTGNLNWNVTNTGTGAACSVNQAPDQANIIGMWSLTTGSTATGRVSQVTGVNQNYFGQGAWVWEMYVKIPTLSNGTDTFKVYAGWGDVTGAGDFTDGVYFTYTDTESSGNWSANAANNSVRTQTSTGVAPSGWQQLRIEINAAGTSAVFKIGGTVVATITTNIPVTSGRESGFEFKIEKSVGTTARTLLVDYFHAYFIPTTVRL